MSVANILVTDDAVYCLTDTLVYEVIDGKGRPCALGPPKADTFLGGFALATRGNCWAADRVAETIADAADFDTAEAALLAFMPALALHKASAEPRVNVEAFLFGWSERHGGPRAVLADLPKHGTAWTLKTLPAGLHLFPSYPGAVVPVPKPGTPPEKIAVGMVKVALAQFSVREERCPDMCIGGAMHLTVAGRDGASQRIIATYPNREALAEVFGDPLADDVAAFRRSMGRAAA